jgi:hypothetical protein
MGGISMVPMGAKEGQETLDGRDVDVLYSDSLPFFATSTAATSSAMEWKCGWSLIIFN